MATILADKIQIDKKTPVIPIEISRASSLQGEAEKSVDKVIIHTQHSLRKEGSRFYINEEEIDLETLNVLDLLILLRKKGISVGFLNNNDYWYYPALCLLDFSNTEMLEIKLTHTPFNLLPYNQLRNLSIIPLENTTIELLNVFSKTTKNIIPFKIKDLIVSTGKFFAPEDLVAVVKISSSKFILKLDNKFTTEKIETVARYLKELKEND